MLNSDWDRRERWEWKGRGEDEYEQQFIHLILHVFSGTMVKKIILFSFLFLIR